MNLKYLFHDGFRSDIPGQFPALVTGNKFAERDRVMTEMFAECDRRMTELVPSSWTCLRAKQNYENPMFETHGVEVEGIDIEVVRQSSLGIEGWALHQFAATNLC